MKRYFLDIFLTTFLDSLIPKRQNLCGSSSFSKCSKFKIDFKNAAKNSEKVFCSFDNYIRIGIVKMSLLRTGYFSSTANVLTSCPKIWDVNKREFSNSISLSVINESDQSAVRQFSKVLGNLYHSACPRVL